MKLFVNEDTRTVVAKITDVQTQMYDSLDKIFPLSYRVPFIRKLVKGMPDTVVGRARCSLYDDFDPEIGIEIARGRAIASHAEMRARIFLKIRDYFADDLGEKLEAKAEKGFDTAETRLNFIAYNFE